MQEVASQVATFGAGCFWGVEAAFRTVPGVIDATAGFMGGTQPNTSYEDVVYGDTNHAEVVQIEFDPTKISYEKLLKVFWFIHDPTQLNRQGNDVGSQYRSVIFTHSDEQQTIAEQSKNEEGVRHDLPVVTEIAQAQTFYPAAEEHQQYIAKNPGGYCHINLGKVADFVKTL